MDRIVFKKQIDSIYEKLYSINESLSSDDSKELIRGFNDGIKEGYEILKQHINEENPFIYIKEGLFGSIAKGIGTAVGATKGLFQQGKKLAGKVWNTVADFSTEVINKIKKGILTAASWISSQPEKIKEFLTGIYNQVVTDLSSAWTTLKDKAQELATTIQTIMSTIKTNIEQGIQSIGKYIAENEDDAKKWFDKNYNLVETTAQEWQKSTLQWMQKAGQTVSDVANKVKSGALSALKGIGICVAVLVFGPIYLIILGIQKVPDLYKFAQKQIEAGLNSIGDYWLSIQQEYAKGWNTGMAATGVSSGKIPGRDETTGRMTPAPENAGKTNIFKFSDFVTEKKRKDDFFKKLK